MSKKVTLHDLILKAASKEKAGVVTTQDDTEPDLSIDLGEHQLFYTVESLKQQLKEDRDQVFTDGSAV